MKPALGILLLAALGAPPSLPAALALPATDAFGYTAALAPYSFTDISGSGTPVTVWAGGADDGSSILNLPFNFRFYGADFNKVAVSSNGYLQFGNQSAYYATTCLGSNLDPRGIVALYWTDLDPGAGGAVYTQVLGSPGNRVVVVQFQDVPQNYYGGSVTAQVRLYEADRSLELAWASTAGAGAGLHAVAGLRSAFDCPNRTALPLSCLQAELVDGLCVRFTYPALEPDCQTPTPSAGPSMTPSPAFTSTATLTPSATPSATASAAPSESSTPTFSGSPTLSDSPSPSATWTVSATAGPSASSTPSASPSFSSTSTPSLSPSPTSSPTDSPSPTASPSATDSPSATASPSYTASLTRTLTPTETPSATRSPTPTRSATPTATPTYLPPAPKPACLVLGQPAFGARTPGSGSAAVLSAPAGVAVDVRLAPYKLYVADTGNHRVLIWNDGTQLYNGRPADGVIGQADFSGSAANRGGAVGPNTLNAPTGLAVDPNNGDLWVADSGNHRVLRFSAPLPLSGASASAVLGQGGSFSSATPNLGGLSAASLQQPTGLSFNSLGVLVVADTGNHRVLRFSAPGASASADAVWGQNGSFNQGLPNQGGGVDAGALNAPRGAVLASDAIWIADSGNHRVLRFSTWPLLSQSANLVLGQPDFASSLPNQGYALPNQDTLSAPAGLALDAAQRVLVADSGNHRVVGFEPNWDNWADQVWGQSSLGSAVAGTGDDAMREPAALFAWGSLLAVAERDNHRVLIYGCGGGLLAASPTPSASASPTRTSTVSPTASFSASPSATPTPTRSPSFSPSPSFSITETHSVGPTSTVSPTASPTSSATPTFSATRTFSLSPTPSLTLSSPPTQTPYPRSADAVIAWPNPAPREGGRICLGFPAAAEARVEIYDRLGQPVAVLDPAAVNPAGGYACWDLRNRANASVAPGVYYARVVADGRVRLGKLTLR